MGVGAVLLKFKELQKASLVKQKSNKARMDGRESCGSQIKWIPGGQQGTVVAGEVWARGEGC